MKISPPRLKQALIISLLLFIFVSTICWITNSQGPLASIISILFIAMSLVFSFFQAFPQQKSHTLVLPPSTQLTPHPLAPLSLDGQSSLPQKPSSQLETLASPATTLKSTAPSPTSEIAAGNIPIQSSHREDWGEAPHVDVLYGREQEIDQLKQWLIHDNCRIIAILGVGGVGKTSLAIKAAEQAQHEFGFVFWRSLHNALQGEDFLKSCLQFLSHQPYHGLPSGLDELISLLIDCLRRHRCLLILDNMEAVLQGGSRAGEYREGYQGYGRLLQRIGEAQHQSCLLLTSREKPKAVVPLDNSIAPVRSLHLAGLGNVEGRNFLQHYGIFGTDEAWKTLISLYSGNPLALKLVAETIREVFGGDIARFLADGEIVFADIYDLVDQQFRRLSPSEQKIMYWLAIEREPVSLDDLWSELACTEQKSRLLEAFTSLKRRSMIVTSNATSFTLQPVIIEYITGELIKRVSKEIQSASIELLASHALMKAQAKEYIRISQRSFILAPLSQQLLITLGKEGLQKQYHLILELIRSTPALIHSYAAGNLLNLLLHAGINLQSYDFSHLAVRQAYLQDALLPAVNFVRANFTTSIFTDTFGGVLSVAFSPDGKLLAAGTANGEVRIWRVATGLPPQNYRGHNDGVRSLVFSPDGQLLVSSGQDRTIRVWQMQTGRCLHTIREYATRVWSLAFNPDGHLFGSGGDDCSVRLWSAQTGKCQQTLPGHTKRVRAIAFSPDGHILASGGQDHTIHVIDMHTGQLLYTLRNQLGEIQALAFSPDGRLLASAGSNQTIHLWDMAHAHFLPALQGHSQRIRTLAFSPDGRLLASAGDDQTVRLWNMATMQTYAILEGHHNRIWSVAFSPDGTMLVSGGDDQAVRLWDARSGSRLYTMQGHLTWQWSVALSAGGRLLASSDHLVRIWDAQTGRCLCTLKGHTNRTRAVVFHPHCDILASASEDQTIRIWNARTGHTITTLQGHTDWVRAIAFHPTGQLLASGSDDKTLRLWNIDDGRCIQALHGYTSEVRTVAFHPNGQTLASGGVDQSIHIWKVDTGNHLKTLSGHTNRVRCIAFSPDGDFLASGSADRTIRIWQSHSGRVQQVLKGHTQGIYSVAFSPDGRLLVSSSEDQTLRIWDTETGGCHMVLCGHDSRIRSVVFSPHGDVLVSGSDDGTIKFWDSRTAECLRTLRSQRPYEQMNITDATGLTETQLDSLRTLGAIESAL